MVSTGCDCFSTPERGGLYWWRLGGGAFLSMNAMTLGLAVNTSEVTASERVALHWSTFVLTLVVSALLAVDFRPSRWTSLETLFVLGITGAFGLSLQSMITGSGPVFFEAAGFLLVVYSLGRELGRYGQQRVWKALAESAPELQQARIGEELRPVTEVRAGDRLRVLPGEAIPVDGVIRAGEAFLHESGMTGESFAVVRREGDAVRAGCHVLDALIEIEATRDGGESELYRLRELLLEGLGRPGREQQFTQQVLAWFVPVVSLLALAVFAAHTHWWGWQKGVYGGLAVLVVACPCALGFATPLAVWTGMTRLRDLGFLARGGDSVEKLAEIDTVVFDKTGTLTWPDQYRVTLRAEPAWQGRERELISLIRAAEEASQHPLGRALARLWNGLPPDDARLERLRLLPGVGLEAVVSGRALTIRLALAAGQQHRIAVLVDREPAALLELDEVLRDSVSATARDLESRGVRVILATGDQAVRAACVPIAERLSQQSPRDKWDFIGRLREQRSRVLFAGDGLNDAPAMSWSHTSIAVSNAAPAVRESAGFLLLEPDWSHLGRAIGIARETVAAIRSNLRWSLGYNAIGIALAATGQLHPVSAALLMTVSSLTVIWRGMKDLDAP